MKIKRLENTLLPKRQRKNDAGYDFYLREDVKIKPRQQVVINTGIFVEIPDGHAGLFALRSSTCVNNPHLILKNPLADSNYRGELHVILYNDSFIKSIKFQKNQRIVSLFVFPVHQSKVEETVYLSETERDGEWNGSSGM